MSYRACLLRDRLAYVFGEKLRCLGGVGGDEIPREVVFTCTVSSDNAAWRGHVVTLEQWPLTDEVERILAVAGEDGSVRTRCCTAADLRGPLPHDLGVSTPFSTQGRVVTCVKCPVASEKPGLE